MDEVKVEFFTNKSVIWYLEQVVKGGLYGSTVSEAVERIVAGTIEDMVSSGLIDEKSTKEEA